jgi:energy-converting hydrogenase Eha subunit C
MNSCASGTRALERSLRRARTTIRYSLVPGMIGGMVSSTVAVRYLDVDLTGTKVSDVSALAHLRDLEIKGLPQ